MPKKPPEIPTWRGHYAGLASRIMGLVIDLLILAIALAVSSMLYELVIKNFSSLSTILLGQTKPESPTTNVLFTVLMIFVVFGVYFIFFWTAIGTTIGGLILGVKVVNRLGKNPNIWQSALRFLAEFFFPLLGVFGSIWILFNRQRRALFDLIAGTYVIYNWDARPDEKFLKRETDQVTGQETDNQAR
jgi:uncharacterized RDD family membrane protein YckC